MSFDLKKRLGSRSRLLAVVILAGVAMAQTVSAQEDENAWDRHRAASETAAKLEKKACADQSGEWRDGEGCVLKSSDGGKLCSAGSECELACVSKLDPRYAKNPFVVGECARTTSLAGCVFYVEGRRVAHAVCSE